MEPKQKPGRKMSDIVPRRPTSAPTFVKASADKKATAGKESPAAKSVKQVAKRKEPAVEPQVERQAAPSGREPDFFTVTVRETRIDAGPPPAFAEASAGEPEEVPKGIVRQRRLVARRGLRVMAVILMVLVAVGAGAWFLLPKAVVALTMKKFPVTFSETVVVAADPATANVPLTLVVPGEALEARANLTLPFTAQNTETVSARATGKLIVYNGYSSAAQSLAATTRFESPDKKIFRIERGVTIPGAKVENGKIIPSSIEITVVAEEAGENYNLPASSGWRIPGFKERFPERYEGFYAEAKEGMRGGFIGERAKPSATELAHARTKIMEGLTDALEGQFLIILSDRFTALPGSRRVTITQEDISPDPEDPHIFQLFGEAVMEQIVFEEPTLKSMLIEKASRVFTNELIAKDFTYALGTSTVDFLKRTLTFPVTGDGVFTEPFDANAFREDMAGKREDELKAAVFAIPGIETASVSLSPFFVRSVPKNVERIEVVVE